jgi:hypothetical protein
MKTKKRLTGLFSIISLCACLCLNAFAQAKDLVQLTHEPITQQLITMMDHNAEVKTMLVDSIEAAKLSNPDRLMNPAQSLEEYYAFIDWAIKAMPWSILQNIPYSSLYDQIDQSLDYFYYINDQPLAALKNKGYYNNSLQYHEPYRTWLINFVMEWGIYLSTTDSWKNE